MLFWAAVSVHQSSLSCSSIVSILRVLVCFERTNDDCWRQILQQKIAKIYTSSAGPIRRQVESDPVGISQKTFSIE